MATKKPLTAHEKKVELAKASAPQYGIYFDGGDTEALQDAVESAGWLILEILTADAEEKTKRQGLAILRDSLPGIHGATVTNCHIEQGK